MQVPARYSGGIRRSWKIFACYAPVLRLHAGFISLLVQDRSITASTAWCRIWRKAKNPPDFGA